MCPCTRPLFPPTHRGRPAHHGRSWRGVPGPPRGFTNTSRGRPVRATRTRYRAAHGKHCPSDPRAGRRPRADGLPYALPGRAHRRRCPAPWRGRLRRDTAHGGREPGEPRRPRRAPGAAPPSRRAGRLPSRARAAPHRDHARRRGVAPAQRASRRSWRGVSMKCSVARPPRSCTSRATRPPFLSASLSPSGEPVRRNATTPLRPGSWPTMTTCS